jgi:CCR4-NOT complex subunit CAF16
MHQVSDGQRKRVQIMLALLKPFKLLIIDEFLNELDVVVRDKFYKYLTKECKSRKGAIIYATHIFDNLDKWSNKIVYISNGNCKYKASMKTFNESQNLFTSVKNVISKDYTTISNKINPKQFGPQFGYGSGRSGLIN